MFRSLLLRQFKLPRSSQLHSTATSKNKSPSLSNQTPKPTDQSPKPENQESSESHIQGHMHTPTAMDKRILVWVKRYPSIDAIPKQITYDCIQRAHTMARIRVCNYLIIFALVGFMFSIWSGKKDVASGKHIISDRMNWVREQRQKGLAEAEAKAKAEAEAAKLQ
ncbi:UPF0389 protein CG9231 [Colletes latitarsis]|uniref:UPF0389 protein CG9231 n=1 Tax=Colletes latitarsis TaxID=2605962 RepID=UPI004035CCD8